MELLQEKLVFRREGAVVLKWPCKLFLLNFRKLLSIPNESDCACEVMQVT